MRSVYCLFDTNNFAPRYVGKTDHSLEDRYSSHRNEAQNGSSVRVHRWMRSVFLSGYDVRICELEGGFSRWLLKGELSGSELSRSEDRWINTFPNLLNVQKKDGRFLDFEVTQKVTDRCRRSCTDIDENHEGFHGVRYHKKKDAYTVRVCYGREDGEVCDIQLTGDELAWGGFEKTSPIWFTHSANALGARDKTRAEIEGTAHFRRICRSEWGWPKDRIGT